MEWPELVNCGTESLASSHSCMQAPVKTAPAEERKVFSEI